MRLLPFLLLVGCFSQPEWVGTWEGDCLWYRGTKKYPEHRDDLRLNMQPGGTGTASGTLTDCAYTADMNWVFHKRKVQAEVIDLQVPARCRPGDLDVPPIYVEGLHYKGTVTGRCSWAWEPNEAKLTLRRVGPSSAPTDTDP